MTATLTTKVCTGCDEEKSLDDFYLDKRFGISRSRCKKCCHGQTAKQRARGYKAPRTEAVKRAQAKWLEDNRDQRREFERQWQREHRDERNARRRKGGRNYGKVQEYVNRRRARKANAEGSHTHEEWLLVLSVYEGRCAYCGDEATTRDHIVPLALGGTDSIDNIVPACRPCNASKGNKPLWEWKSDVCEI